ncbi:hypothetical protein [Archangium lipolyticum]|uniref:hypothetical protein n=1 Tax=Archangium lipolyticum TaxID=2970465 RepID=UPI002149D4C8|nr:hypothetical protein [Archangium lipolyticum]
MARVESGRAGSPFRDGAAESGYNSRPVRTRIGALVLAAAAGLFGCDTPSSEGCASKQVVPVTDVQGDVLRCTASEDCPRSSRVSLCVTDTDSFEECIRCENTQCVRITPEAC